MVIKMKKTKDCKKEMHFDDLDTESHTQICPYHSLVLSITSFFSKIIKKIIPIKSL